MSIIDTVLGDLSTELNFDTDDEAPSSTPASVAPSSLAHSGSPLYPLLAAGGNVRLAKQLSLTHPHSSSISSSLSQPLTGNSGVSQPAILTVPVQLVARQLRRHLPPPPYTATLTLTLACLSLSLSASRAWYKRTTLLSSSKTAAPSQSLSNSLCLSLSLSSANAYFAFLSASLTHTTIAVHRWLASPPDSSSSSNTVDPSLAISLTRASLAALLDSLAELASLPLSLVRPGEEASAALALAIGAIRIGTAIATTIDPASTASHLSSARPTASAQGDVDGGGGGERVDEVPVVPTPPEPLVPAQSRDRWITLLLTLSSRHARLVDTAQRVAAAEGLVAVEQAYPLSLCLTVGHLRLALQNDNSATLAPLLELFSLCLRHSVTLLGTMFMETNVPLTPYDATLTATALGRLLEQQANRRPGRRAAVAVALAVDQSFVAGGWERARILRNLTEVDASLPVLDRLRVEHVSSLLPLVMANRADGTLSATDLLILAVAPVVSVTMRTVVLRMLRSQPIAELRALSLAQGGRASTCLSLLVPRVDEAPILVLEKLVVWLALGEEKEVGGGDEPLRRRVERLAGVLRHIMPSPLGPEEAATASLHLATMQLVPLRETAKLFVLPALGQPPARQSRRSRTASDGELLGHAVAFLQAVARERDRSSIDEVTVEQVVAAVQQGMVARLAAQPTPSPTPVLVVAHALAPLCPPSTVAVILPFLADVVTPTWISTPDAQPHLDTVLELVKVASVGLASTSAAEPLLRLLTTVAEGANDVETKNRALFYRTLLAKGTLEQRKVVIGADADVGSLVDGLSASLRARAGASGSRNDESVSARQEEPAIPHAPAEADTPAPVSVVLDEARASSLDEDGNLVTVHLLVSNTSVEPVVQLVVALDGVPAAEPLARVMPGQTVPLAARLPAGQCDGAVRVSVWLTYLSANPVVRHARTLSEPLVLPVTAIGQPLPSDDRPGEADDDTLASFAVLFVDDPSTAVAQLHRDVVARAFAHEVESGCHFCAYIPASGEHASVTVRPLLIDGVPPALQVERRARTVPALAFAEELGTALLARLNVEQNR